jgi:transposase
LLTDEQVEIIKKRAKEKPFSTAKECVEFIKEQF